MQGEGKCCPPGSWPALKSDHKSKGEKVEGLDFHVYHAGSGDKYLIIMEDIWGAQSGRHESVADTFAQLGYNVYMPLCLDPPFVGDYDLPKIMENIKGQKWETVHKRYDALWQYLKSKGAKQCFTAGFCWGVYVLFKLANSREEIVAISGMHPSIGAAGAFGENPDDLVKGSKCPAYFMPASNDPENVREEGQYVKILSEKFGKQKTGATFFSEMNHGWVVRGDVSIENVKRDTQKAIELSHQYFSKF